MNTNRLLSYSLIAASSFSLLSACGPAPTATPEPSTSPTATASPSTPAATATPETPVATATPEAPAATATPEPSVSPVASTDPSASATPEPLPTAQEDISVVEKTTFNGKVYDDTNAPLDGVKVTARSLNTSVVYEVETTTAGGTYAFNNAPAGVQIEITASRAGYTTRRRVEVLKSNKQGDPDANRYDFGTTGDSTFGTEFNALSDRPEVTMVTPGRNASGINPGTSFVLKFSEPMDRQTVVDAFEIRAFGGSTQAFRIKTDVPQKLEPLRKSASGEQLTVDNDITFNSGAASDGQLVFAGDLIWDKAAFNASWNSDDTEVTMTFKEERALPTDTDSDNVPDYSVSFEAGNAGLKDKSGITRNEKHFKLTEGRFEEYYKFSINTDEDKPEVDSITVVDGGNSGSTIGDTIKVRFSERMIHRTLAGAIAGGINGQITEAAGAVGSVTSSLAADNYILQINNGMTQDWNTVSAGSGVAVFDSNDPTNKTVLLFTSNSSDSVFNPGDNVEITVKTTVLDPAGNSVDSSNNDASAVAG